MSDTAEDTIPRIEISPGFFVSPELLLGISPTAPLPEGYDEPRWLELWKPEPYQVEWFRRFINTCRHGTKWQIPKTKVIYAIDKKAKAFVLISGQPDEWYWKNKKILAMFGYESRIAELRGIGKMHSKFLGSE